LLLHKGDLRAWLCKPGMANVESGSDSEHVSR
jgi:hypothetical protein